MNSEIDELLDQVDQWKLGLHKRLKGLSAAQRKAYWNRIHKQAEQNGLPVVNSAEPAKPPGRKNRRIG